MLWPEPRRTHFWPRNLVESLSSYPTCFARLTEANRRGTTVLTSTRVLPELAAPRPQALLADGGYVVNMRPAADYAAGHIPGSVSIPLRDRLATWLD